MTGPGRNDEAPGAEPLYRLVDALLEANSGRYRERIPIRIGIIFISRDQFPHLPAGFRNAGF